MGMFILQVYPTFLDKQTGFQVSSTFACNQTKIHSGKKRVQILLHCTSTGITNIAGNWDASLKERQRRKCTSTSFRRNSQVLLDGLKECTLLFTYQRLSESIFFPYSFSPPFLKYLKFKQETQLVPRSLRKNSQTNITSFHTDIFVQQLHKNKE